MAKEYVEREAAIALLHDSEIMGIPVWNAGLARGIEKLEGLPAAEVVEVRHGRWVYEPGHIPHCSECGRYSDDADTGEAICCPFCGASMDGGQDDV